MVEFKEGTARSEWLSLTSSELIRAVVYPLYQRRQRRCGFRYLGELRRYEFAPREVIDAIQWQRLQIMLRHAAEHVPYYRRVFHREGINPAEIRSPREFARIPILTKTRLLENAADLLAENSRERFLNASGGSTGKPVHFYQDESYWNHASATQWFIEGWWGIRPGDRTASLWGADRDLPQQDWRERMKAAICQLRTCNAFSITQEQLEEFAQMLTAWKPRYVIGYSSALSLFAQFLLKRPYLRIRPIAVKSTAEALSPTERTVIGEAFQCPVYNFYGSREVNNLAAECPSRMGLHISALSRYIEIVDTDGNPVGPCVPGRVLVTDLTNFAMPFIRYEIEDVGSWSAAPCRCGRPFPLLENLLGRKSDFIVASSGKLIHGEFFTHLFYSMPQVTSFQVIQESLRFVRVQVVLRPNTTDPGLEDLRHRIGQALGPEVSCEVATVAKIERPSSGKHRFTVSSVPIRWGAAHLSPLRESKVGEHHER
jgi:phenylacetate-coenzyme A ligase PaaK-like adenylate-forming protein